VTGPHQRADVLVEERPGPLPTIIVGGFVPDATDAFYLLRGGLMPHGSVFYLNYPRGGFSTELFLAQLEDLIEELAVKRGRRPVLIAVSFGAGLALELFRRAAAAGRELPLAGVVLISPVACTTDLLDPAEAKPSTLLGRVIKPYLSPPARSDHALVEKSRAVFLKMFEAGAHNKAALRFLLTREESLRLRDSVLSAINAIDGNGAAERVQALCALPELREPRSLFAGPALVLFAEKENSVLVGSSPTWRELRARVGAWFPRGRGLTVTNTPDNPVQHASLIFHSQNFQPHLAAFYRALRSALRQAA
jgi:pimeloyl-ACP methyl ester carboxylesterase